MYDPKFEKAIQQKMEELEFRPPEAVWVNIEKAVMVKRRRRAGYVWRYLLPGVFVVAAAGLYLYKNAAQPAQTTLEAAKTPAGASVATTGSGSEHTASPIHMTDQTQSADQAQSTGQIQSAGQTRSAAQIQTPSAGRIAAGGGQIPSTGRAHTFISGQTQASGQTTASEQVPGPDETQGSDYVTTSGQGAAVHEASTGDNGTSTGNGSTAGPGSTTEQGKLSPWFYLPGLADQRLAAQVRGTLNTKKTNAIAIAKLPHPQQHWEAGFIAGGGTSRLNKLNNEPTAYLAASAPSTSFAALSTQGSSKHYVSDIRPGASFNGGIYLQRALSDRWIFNTGMNLHYYSNRVSIGQQVTTYVQSSASLFLPTAVAYSASQNTNVYTPGNSQWFTNKYYFLELPVGIQFKVNKSHLLPIFVEGGFSLSRLMGANSLLYNENSGLYSKDGDIVKKTQFNIQSALLVGLPLHGVNIQLGPEIQYGLTPLVNTPAVGDQHFLYTGIRLVIIPGRK